MQLTIEEIELARLPALPQVLGKLLAELNNGNLQVQSLASLIRQDSALTIKLLAVANSAAFKRNREVDSIAHCVHLLGLKMVKMLAVSLSMQQFLNGFPVKGGFDFNHYWQHSLLNAFLGKAIAERVRYPFSEEAYLAGLLHDIGKLALLVFKSDEYLPLLASQSDDEDLISSEMHAFGADHANLGADLAQHWQILPSICDAIRYHHGTAAEIGKADELVRIIALANAMSVMALDNDHPAIPLAQAFFGLSQDETQMLNAMAHSELIALAMSIGMEIQLDPEKSHPTKRKPLATVENSPGQRGLLGEEIKSTTLLSLANDAGDDAVDRRSLLESMLQAATILFEPRQAMLFEWDAVTNLLAPPLLPGQEESASRFRLPLEANRSLIADALLRNAVTSSFDQDPAVPQSLIDQQITHMASADGLVCVPISNARFVYGVLVLAYGKGAQHQMNSNLKFAHSFARQAASSLERIKQQAEDTALTDTLRSEAYKLQARKIVHEANNPLAILKNYLRALDYKLEGNTTVSNELDVLNDEIDRVAGIIRKFAQPQADDAKTGTTANVNSVVQDVLTICEQALFKKPGISVVQTLGKALPEAGISVGALKQILINLLKNAAEALPEGGQVTVSTSSVASQEHGNSVCISIADNGPGIPPQVMSAMFSPMQTTKGAGNSGLGLSIIADLLNDAGGSVQCKSNPGAGTTFEILLPCQPQNKSDQASKRDPQS